MMRQARPLLLLGLPAARAGETVGLMGGSFNPPHHGHFTVAATALRRLGLDQLWWLVSPGNPLKSVRDLSPLAERMAGCRALARHPRMEVTGFESELPTAYSADTLNVLSARYPRTRFVWVMGADNLAEVHRWRRWRDIFRSFPVAVVDRPGWHLKALSSPAARVFWRYRTDAAMSRNLALLAPPAWVFLPARLSALSSTDLRHHAIRNATD